MTDALGIEDCFGGATMKYVTWHRIHRVRGLAKLYTGTKIIKVTKTRRQNMYKEQRLVSHWHYDLLESKAITIRIFIRLQLSLTSSVSKHG